MRVRVLATLSVILIACFSPVFADDEAEAFAWVSYVEGGAARLGEGVEPTALETADDLLATDRLALGEGAKLTIVLASGDGLGTVVTLRGRVEGTLAELLGGAARDRLPSKDGEGAARDEEEPTRVPLDLAGAILEPWDVDLGVARRTRAATGPLGGIYPSGKVIAPLGDFLFVQDIDLPEDGTFEVRLYAKNPSRGATEPVASVRARASPIALDEAVAKLAKGKSCWWTVAALLADGTEGLVSVPTAFVPTKNPFQNALPTQQFTSPEARSSWHLARAKALVKKKLYADAYREYTRLEVAGGGSKKVTKEMKRLETKLGLDEESAAILKTDASLVTESSSRLRLTDGSILAGRLVRQGEEAVFFESLGTRYRIPRAKVEAVESTGTGPLPSAAPFVTLTSKRYRLETNAGKEYGEEALRHLEALHDAFQGAFGKDLKAHRAKNLRAKVFRDATDFRAYLDAKHADKRDGQGFYSFGDATLYMYRSFRGEEETTWRTLYHEGTHQLLHMLCNQNGASNGLPHFWLLEAIPTYMESLAWDGDALVRGAPNPVRVKNFDRIVKAGGIVPWERFLGLRQAEFKSADLYDQAHALIWYLKHGTDGAYAKKLPKYVKWVLSSRGRTNVAKKTLGKDLVEIAAGVEPYFKAEMRK